MQVKLKLVVISATNGETYDTIHAQIEAATTVQAVQLLRDDIADLLPWKGGWKDRDWVILDEMVEPAAEPVRAEAARLEMPLLPYRLRTDEQFRIGFGHGLLITDAVRTNQAYSEGYKLGREIATDK